MEKTTLKNICSHCLVLLFLSFTLTSCIDGIFGDDDDDDSSVDDDDDDFFDDDDDDDARSCDELFLEFSTCEELIQQMQDCGFSGKDIGYSSLTEAFEECEAHRNCDYFVCADTSWKRNCDNWEEDLKDCDQFTGGGCDRFFSEFDSCGEMIDQLGNCNVEGPEIGYSSMNEAEDECEDGGYCDVFECLDDAWDDNCNELVSEIKECDLYEDSCDDKFNKVPNFYRMMDKIRDCGIDPIELGFDTIQDATEACYEGYDCSYWWCLDGNWANSCDFIEFYVYECWYY